MHDNFFVFVSKGIIEVSKTKALKKIFNSHEITFRNDNSYKGNPLFYGIIIKVAYLTLILVKSDSLNTLD